MDCANLVSNPFYLSLDPDVIAVKPVREDDLVWAGRALLDHESKLVHRQWWEDGARMLDVDPALDQPGMHVTPVLYARKIWQRCFARLEEVHRQNWAALLLTTESWGTEMSLYYLTLESLFSLEQFHVSADEVGRSLHSEGELWSSEEFSRLQPNGLFSDANSGLFAVLSSSGRIEPAVLAAGLAPWVAIDLQAYQPARSARVRGLELYGGAVRRLRRGLAHQRGTRGRTEANRAQ